MSDFIFKLTRNPVSGANEWAKVAAEDANFFQDVARSAYADMLHDHERNVLYYEALKNVIADFKLAHPNKPVHVVDIGTGTGLLSMMAVEAGADKVTAIEAFEPVAMLARKVIKQNGYEDKISVISKRSNDIDSDELDEKGDIAVAEVFDTELIGENALQTFADAQKNLLKRGAKIVPAKAKFFAQLIHSTSCLDWNCAKPIDLPQYGVKIVVPAKVGSCPGTDMVHDVQLNQLPLDSFTPVSEPIEIFSFDFEKQIAFREHKTFTVSIDRDLSERAKSADVVFTWWELDMDGKSRLPLSTKPIWETHGASTIAWRDHWIQNIHFLPRTMRLQPGMDLCFHASHDEFMFWFSVSEKKRYSVLVNEIQSVYKRPECVCKLHQILTKNNMARFNETDRYEKFCETSATILPGRRCVSFGECSLLPLMALQMGAAHVYIVEPEKIVADIIAEYAEANGLSHKLSLIEHVGLIPRDSKIDAVIVDPFFTSSFLPWHNLHFWRLVFELKQQKMLSNEAVLLPNHVKMFVLPVEFEHLWKIKAPIDDIEGFSVKLFDDIIQAALKKADNQIEPQPLWEYNSTALSEPRLVLSFNLNDDFPLQSSEHCFDIRIPHHAKCNGVVFWMEWFHNDQPICSSGLDTFDGQRSGSALTGQRPQWRRSCKQAVYFLPHPIKTGSTLRARCQMDVMNEEFEFALDVL